MIFGEQTRPEGCITDLKFDAWFAGELSVEAVGEAQAHIAACSRCQQRQAMLSAEREAFIAASHHTRLPWRTIPMKRKYWAVAGALATAAISAAAVVALYVRPQATEIEQPVRLKGAAHIGFFVQRGDKSERAMPLYTVHPKDRVRFVYTSLRPAYLAIYGLDAHGKASVYFPAGQRAERVSAGSDVVLGSAVELDEVLGTEKVFALFCEAEFQVADPKNRLAKFQNLRPTPGCRLDSLTWNRERAP
jgi:hypothetical protein